MSGRGLLGIGVYAGWIGVLGRDYIYYISGSVRLLFVGARVGGVVGSGRVVGGCYRSYSLAGF